MTFPLPTDIAAGTTTTGHKAHSDQIHETLNDWIDAKADFNVDPANSASVNQTNLNAAFAEGESSEIAVHLPPGTIDTDGPVTWDGGYPMIQGHGQRTKLNFSSNTADGLVAGDGGAISNDQGMAGFVRDLVVDSAVSKPGTPNFKAGIVLDGIHNADLSNLYVRDFDIGYDLRNNCFGSTLTKCSARYALNNVGFLMQQGSQSGNDLTLIDCWLGGLKAAVNMDVNAGGFQMFGGQLMCPVPTSDDDDAGALRLGKTYNGGGTGGSNGRVSLYSVSFEGIDHAWCIRAFSTIRLYIYGGSAHENSDDILGFFKHSNSDDDYIYLSGFEIASHGTWPSPFTSITPGGSTTIIEVGVNGEPSLEGGGTADLSDAGGIFAYDEVAGTISLFKGDGAARMRLGGGYLRFDSGVLQSSTDNSTWSAV